MTSPPLKTIRMVWSLVLLLIIGAEGQHGIHGPVFILEPPAVLSFSNATGSQVSCSAHGSPPPDVTWVKQDGSLVTAVPGFRQTLGNGTLYFPPFRAEDYREDVHSTVYRCRASNLGGAILSRDVRVRAVVQQRYEVQVYRAHVLLANTAVLHCVIPAFVKDYVKVTSWFRDDAIILPARDDTGGRYVVTTDGDLHIRSAQPGDGTSRYSCLTIHALTGERRRSAPAVLIVTDPTSSMPPRLTQRSVTLLSVEQGADVTLSCGAQGNPSPTFTWYRDAGSQLGAVQSSIRITPSQDVLHIRHVGLEDSGRWVCKVSNQFGEQRLETQLSITAQLSAHVQPQLQVVNSGETAAFNCSVSGSPVESVSWLHNAEAVADHGRVHLLSQHVLVVSGVTRQDRGMYQCVVRNERETSQGSAELRLGDTGPELRSRFTEQVLRPGSHVSLHCIATGSPPPQFTWTLDGETLMAANLGHRYAIGQYVNLEGDVVSHVNITSVRVEDGGRYACSATNSLGTVNHSARLNVYGPPYIRVLGAVQAIAGQDVTVYCPYSGYPISSIHWERRGQDLPLDLRHQSSTSEALTISRVQASVHGGSYLCSVRGVAGEVATREIQLTVNSPPVVEPFSFPSSLQEGGRAQATCSVTAGDLPMHFSWFKDGAPLPRDLQIEERDSGDFYSMLVLKTVTSRHSGAYTCIATNSAASSNFTAKLIVKVAPQWVSEPHDVATLAGTSVGVQCQAQGFPEPQITWLRGQHRLSTDFQPLDRSGGRIDVTRNGSLVIQSPRTQDEGYYVCQANNGIDPALSKVVALTVNEPVRFDEASRNVTSRRGDAVTLSCDVRGDHPIQVTWLLNGQMLHQSNYRLSFSETKMETGLQSQLIIGQTDRQDSGMYICQAGNAFGQSEQRTQLVVQEAPDPPMDMKVVEVGSRAVRLSWRPPFDGHSSLIGYILQYKPANNRLGMDDWQHADYLNLSISAVKDTSSSSMISDQQETTLLNGLHPATTYHIRMLAANGIEHSRYTVPIAVRTQEEVPTGAPQGINVETQGPDQLQVTWKPPLPEMCNGDLLGYTVYWHVHGGAEYNSSNRTLRGATVTEVRLSGLRKFTRYDVSVAAFNSVGLGPQSAPFTATTQEGVPEAPPLSVGCTPLSSQNVKVNWLPPPSNQHGGLLLGYKVIYRPVVKDNDMHLAGSEVKRTSNTETFLHGLLKFTNYSIRLLAYTGVGDGVASDPVFCVTEQDVPGSPAGIKALSLTSDSIMVSWLPPDQPNGHILQYTVYVADPANPAKPTSFPVRLGPSSDLVFEVRSLAELQRYEFWVTATTVVGEGESTHPVSQTPNSRAPARIASFSQIMRRAAKSNILLSCVTVGNPTPTTTWQHHKEPLRAATGLDYHISEHGTLAINRLEKFSEGNYSCLAKNLFGEDQITYQLLVLVAPEPPRLELQSATNRDLQLRWKVTHDGGAPLQGFVLSYKRDHGNWQEVQLDADRTTHTLRALHCGTTYHAYLTAHNMVGNSRPSAIVTATTKGGVPTLPSAARLLLANITSLTLHLMAWPDGGCPLLYFVVEYRLLEGVQEWTLVDNNAPAETLLLRDLTPETWYQLRLTAHNDAGSTTAHFNFATTTLAGGTVAPPHDAHTSTEGADVYMLVLAVCVVILLISAVLLGYVFIHRRYCVVEAEGYKPSADSHSACNSTAELDNKRNCQQVYSSSPSKMAEQRGVKHIETPSELYEMSPYATFAVPTEPSTRGLNTATLDYTVQFKTFGHLENESGAQKKIHFRPKKSRTITSDGESSEQCMSRHRHKSPSRDKLPGQDSGSESGSVSPWGNISYRLPVKTPRSLELYRLDSSTESNEPSPLLERRSTPRHYQSAIHRTSKHSPDYQAVTQRAPYAR